MRSTIHSYLKNILLVFRSPHSLLRGVIAGLVVGVLGWYFMDIDLIIGNQGHVVAYTEIVLFSIFVLLFGLFVSISVYKILYFRSTDTGQLGVGGVGGLLSLLVIGCPACSITLASYIGLASVISLLPYNGLELKVVGILFLVYACINSLHSLHTCSLQAKKQEHDHQFSIRMWAWLIGILVCVRAIVDYGVQQGWFTL